MQNLINWLNLTRRSGTLVNQSKQEPSLLTVPLVLSQRQQQELSPYSALHISVDISKDQCGIISMWLTQPPKSCLIQGYVLNLSKTPMTSQMMLNVVLDSKYGSSNLSIIQSVLRSTFQNGAANLITSLESGTLEICLSGICQSYEASLSTPMEHGQVSH